MFRPYQTKALELCREAYWGPNPVKRVLLELSTGGGKTVIFCHVMKTLAMSGQKVIMLVRGRDLVKQASDRLHREKVPHGVLMSNHWNYRPNENIQICSIDTVHSRKLKFPKLDFVVVDEVHMATTAAYEEFFAEHPEVLVLGVTATPWPRKSLHKLAERVIKPITFDELVEQGYLVPPAYYCPSTPNLKGVKIDKSTGDYNQSQLAKAVDKGELIGDVVEHWKKLGQGRPTLLFDVNVLNSKHMAARFNQEGISAVHCDANTPEGERDQVMADHEAGKIKVVCNVNIWSTGKDMPWVSCIIMRRPTKSKILYVQQAGRGTRPYKGKDNFILLDHAGNVSRHGFINDVRKPSIWPDGPKLDTFEDSEAVTICENFGCFTAYRGAKCPVCGRTNEPRIMEVKDEKAGQLAQVTSEQIYLLQLKATRKAKNWSHTWVWKKFVAAYGKQAALDLGLKEPHVPQFVRDRIERMKELNAEAADVLRQYSEVK